MTDKTKKMIDDIEAEIAALPAESQETVGRISSFILGLIELAGKEGVLAVAYVGARLLAKSEAEPKP